MFNNRRLAKYLGNIYRTEYCLAFKIMFQRIVNDENMLRKHQIFKNLIYTG